MITISAKQVIPNSVVWSYLHFILLSYKGQELGKGLARQLSLGSHGIAVRCWLGLEPSGRLCGAGLQDGSLRGWQALRAAWGAGLWRRAALQPPSLACAGQSAWGGRNRSKRSKRSTWGLWGLLELGLHRHLVSLPQSFVDGGHHSPPRFQRERQNPHPSPAGPSF